MLYHQFLDRSFLVESISLSIHSRKLTTGFTTYLFVQENESSNKLNWSCAWSSSRFRFTDGSRPLSGGNLYIPVYSIRLDFIINALDWPITNGYNGVVLKTLFISFEVLYTKPSLWETYTLD